MAVNVIFPQDSLGIYWRKMHCRMQNLSALQEYEEIPSYAYDPSNLLLYTMLEYACVCASFTSKNRLI